MCISYTRDSFSERFLRLPVRIFMEINHSTNWPSLLLLLPGESERAKEICIRQNISGCSISLALSLSLRGFAARPNIMRIRFVAKYLTTEYLYIRSECTRERDAFVYVTRMCFLAFPWILLGLGNDTPEIFTENSLDVFVQRSRYASFIFFFPSAERYYDIYFKGIYWLFRNSRGAGYIGKFRGVAALEDLFRLRAQ